MADFSELQVQMTLTVGEMKDLVALLNLAGEVLPEDQRPEIIGEVSEMYFRLMDNLADGFLGEFEPE